jgi:hypothetical protein
MLLLLTYFHLYSRKHVLQDTSSESSGKQTKSNKKRKAERVFQKCAKEKNEKGPSKLGRIPPWRIFLFLAQI